jgi:hypothetical protein
MSSDGISRRSLTVKKSYAICAFKVQPENSHLLLYINEIISNPLRVIDSVNLLHANRMKVTLVARPLITPSCAAGANALDLQAEYLFILCHYFLSPPLRAAHETFSNSYGYKEVSSKRVHRW